MPQAIDFLLLTHAHLDHCGRLPLLVKRGFRGEIIATAATRELAQIVMLDAAHMSEEDAQWRTRHARNGKPVDALYSQDDVAAAMRRFGRVAAYGPRSNSPRACASATTMPGTYSAPRTCWWR